MTRHRNSLPSCCRHDFVFAQTTAIRRASAKSARRRAQTLARAALSCTSQATCNIQGHTNSFLAVRGGNMDNKMQLVKYLNALICILQSGLQRRSLPLAWRDDEFGASAECQRLTAACESAIDDTTFEKTNERFKAPNKTNNIWTGRLVVVDSGENPPEARTPKK